MRQRVMIAMALINDPDLLIADEPTTALDVTTQAQILDLMAKLQQDFGSAIIMITHDLGVVAEIADDVVVMYAARVAEQAPSTTLQAGRITRTRGACSARCRGSTSTSSGSSRSRASRRRCCNPPRGCRFHPRCPYVMEICKEKEPELLPVSHDPTHLQRCHLDEETKDREAAKLTHMGQAA